MSAKNRGSLVITQEFYPTPLQTINSIINEINFNKVHSFCEPCNGSGVITNAIPSNVSKYHFELSEGTDYLLPENSEQVDLILTNPPFSLAKEFIIKARTEAKCVIMLQRVNFLGSKARKKFWEENPPTHLFVLSERPKFVARCNNNSKVNGVKVCSNKESYQITEPRNTCTDCGKQVVPASDATEYAWICWDTAGIITRQNGVYTI